LIAATSAGSFDAVIDIRRRRDCEEAADAYLFFLRPFFLVPFLAAAFAFRFFAMLPS
jgi:hypothetical protein